MPTWNYAVAHIAGTLEIIEDTEALAAIVSELSVRHETAIGSDWRFDPGRDDLRVQLKGIVGFRMEATRIELKFKLNQNHPEANRSSVVNALLAQGDEDARWPSPGSCSGDCNALLLRMKPPKWPRPKNQERSPEWTSTSAASTPSSAALRRASAWLRRSNWRSSARTSPCSPGARMYSSNSRGSCRAPTSRNGSDGSLSTPAIPLPCARKSMRS